jgi:molybdopterin-guanine dinucleotide biosynthesis protein
MPPLRIAFCGPSGTGKTTLATYISQMYGIPLNPVGSRSVAKAMGFDSPYDVDKAGKRAEFQRRLVTEKIAWEAVHDQFVTDRTTFDNLAYTMLHDVAAIDEALYDQVCEGFGRYRFVYYLSSRVFCNPAGDPNRVQDMTYHKLSGFLIEALVTQHQVRDGQRVTRCIEHDLSSRYEWIRRELGPLPV